ncbi:hypothetical protein N656DRAFT_782544 [Canariomyces notabilis]|uniref:Uncharacterized protein n=1 Tax=Canariomyces notabilis TaxID=2074819 RepID=A0AAN6QN04_9PEZI|nr:hypothetical protein N656DRAFT_782544 [Canariomyces arenarius]
MPYRVLRRACRSSTFGIPSSTFAVSSSAFGIPSSTTDTPSSIFGMPSSTSAVLSSTLGILSMSSTFGVLSNFFGVSSTLMGGRRAHQTSYLPTQARYLLPFEAAIFFPLIRDFAQWRGYHFHLIRESAWERRQSRGMIFALLTRHAGISEQVFPGIG